MKTSKPLKTLGFQSDRRGSIPLRAVDCFLNSPTRKIPETLILRGFRYFYAHGHPREDASEAAASGGALIQVLPLKHNLPQIFVMRNN